MLLRIASSVRLSRFRPGIAPLTAHHVFNDFKVPVITWKFLHCAEGSPSSSWDRFDLVIGSGKYPVKRRLLDVNLSADGGGYTLTAWPLARIAHFSSFCVECYPQFQHFRGRTIIPGSLHRHLAFVVEVGSDLL